MSSATAAAGICPYIPAGSEAITTLWTPMRPHEYELLSVGGLAESAGLSCSSSSIASAAARSLAKAAIHPTVYSSLLSDVCFEESESIVKW